MALTYVKSSGIDITGNYTMGNVTATYFFGNGSQLTNISSSNITGQVSNSLVASTVYTNAQPNITSVGSLTSLTVSGLVTATSGGIKVGNLQDTSGTNTISLSSGNVTMIGNLTVGTAGTGNVTATYFIGNGSQLTGLPASYANANVAAYLPMYTGNIAAGNAALGNLVSANYFSGNGSLLTSIIGANVTGTVAYATTANSVAGGNVSGQVSNALVAGTVYTNAQPNITSVGTLTDLSVNGNIVVGGNFTVNGTLTSINSTIVQIDDLAIVLANDASTSSQANGAGVIINGASANMLYIDSSNSFVFSHKITADGGLLSNINGSNVSGAVGLATYATTANSVAGGNVSGAVGLATYATTANSVAGSNVSGAVGLATYATTANSVAGANVSGAVAYATTANAVAGANVSGAVTYATTANSVAGGNVSGQVANSLIAGTVYTNAQPNITSVGTLTSLTVSGLITATTSGIKVGNIKDTSGTNTISLLSGEVSIIGGLTVGTAGSSNISGANNISATTFTGNLITAAQPNITSIGTLTSLTVDGVTTLGSVSNVKITGGSANYVLQTDGTGNLTWASAGTGSGSTITDDTTTNTTYYPVYATGTSGSFTVAGISTTKMQFNPSSGQLTVQDLNTLSDATLKTNVEQISDPFSVLSQLFGMGFNWIDNGKKSYGVLAQALEKVLPELVNENAQGKKTVNYIPIIAFLIEAVNRQQADIEALKAPKKRKR